jgi:hypothetical protein
MARTLYAPPYWTPVIIRDGNRANQLIRERGYRNEKPGVKVAPIAPEVITEPVAIPTKAATAGFPINKASFDELVALDGVGAVTAKKLIEHRPYDAHEDLIAVAERINWLSMEIDFSE